MKSLWHCVFCWRIQSIYYFHRRLASECIVSSASRHAVMLCCVFVRRISLGGEGNALYPVLSS